MPELPEVETICRGLAPRMNGQSLARLEIRRRDLRLPVPAGLEDRLDGQRMTAVTRRAKYVLIGFAGGDTLILHLGMSGRLVILDRGTNQPPEKHDHAIFHLADGSQIRFNDARRFGLLALTATEALDQHRLFARLGPDPFDPGLVPARLAAALAGKSCTIKAALLDQRVIAGLGNIYVAEALFLAGISPLRDAGSVRGKRAERLLSAIRDVLRRAIAAGGSSLRDYVQSSGELGYFQHQWAVYGKEGEACPGCDCDRSETGGIRRIVQQGRSTFYCSRRQR